MVQDAAAQAPATCASNLSARSGGRGIVWAAHHRRREVYVGIPTVKAILANKAAPKPLDLYLAHTAYEAQQTNQPVDAERPDNLFEPLPGDHGARGEFNDRARDCSAQLWITTHRSWVLGLGGTIAAIGLAAALARSR
jgi:hypothetical protein